MPKSKMQLFYRALPIVAAMVLFGVSMQNPFEKKSGLQLVNDLSRQYLETRDTNILAQLTKKILTPDLGPKAAGALKNLAPEMRDRPTETRTLILPALADGIASGNKFLVEPSAFALEAYTQADPAIVEYLAPYLPKLQDYVLPNRFGGGPIAVVKILSQLPDPQTNIIKVLRE